MRPLRLLLDGFGSYRQPASVDFTDIDFFALTGPTGSGKSTVIDGLCFALYGTVPRWGRENAIAHALAPAANACRVCLVFEAAGARYAAVRALARRPQALDGTGPRVTIVAGNARDPNAVEDVVAGSDAVSCSGSATSTSPSRSCSPRAGSPSSCTPSLASVRTCWSSSSRSACTSRSASAPGSARRPPPTG